MRLLSAPMNVVYSSPCTARSSTMTGIFFRYASATGFGQRRGFLGADDQQIDALRDELLDLRALHERVVLRVLEDDLRSSGCRGGRLA